MSFAKAKIQRFNEIKVCTPSPAKYNVNSEKKVRFGLLSHHKNRSGSPPPSETESIQSTPCFQTPNVPKKKKFLGLSSSKSIKFDVEELKDKIVECKNKDRYINELSEQLEEMKLKLSGLQQEIDVLEKERNLYTEELNTQDKILTDLNQKHAKEMDLITAITKQYKQIKKDYDVLKEDNCLEIAKCFSQIGKFQELHDKAVATLQRQFEDRMAFQLEQQAIHHKKEISCLIQRHSEEDEQKTNHYKVLLNEKEAKIKLLQENFQDVNLLSDLHTNEKISELANEWRQKLETQKEESDAILRECQEISEYSIIQSEIEKNFIRTKLAEKEIAYETLKVEHDELLHKHKNNLNIDLQQELNSTLAALKVLKTEKHAYEIAINTFKDTIEVLKKRLISSDGDVEQLKEELANADDKMLHLESKCGELANQLIEVQIINEALEADNEKTALKMRQQIKIIEQNLLEKVLLLESRFQHIDEEGLLLEQQALNTQAQELISQSRLMIEKLEEDNLLLENKNVELFVQLDDVKMRLDEEIEDGAEIRKKYIEKSGKYDELSHQFEQILQELDRIKEKNCELEKSGKKVIKKSKYVEDKENLASPKRLFRVESPGPLKEKN